MTVAVGRNCSYTLLPHRSAATMMNGIQMLAQRVTIDNKKNNFIALVKLKLAL